MAKKLVLLMWGLMLSQLVSAAMVPAGTYYKTSPMAGTLTSTWTYIYLGPSAVTGGTVVPVDILLSSTGPDVVGFDIMGDTLTPLSAVDLGQYLGLSQTAQPSDLASSNWLALRSRGTASNFRLTIMRRWKP